MFGLNGQSRSITREVPSPLTERLLPRTFLIPPYEKNEKGRPFGTALDRAGRVKSGGAGIRTPVRDKIDHSVYVRIPPIEVSSRWPVDSPLLDKSFLISPTAGRHSD